MNFKNLNFKLKYVFLKDKEVNKDNNLIKITALLIHAMKIDENYSNKEEAIIKQI